jgi:hypothetical protein
MANKVYESSTVELIDGTQIYITPLKIFYLRDFMSKFSEIENASTEDEKIDVLIECVAFAMNQFRPEIASPELVADSMDIKTMYKVVEIAGGISFSEKAESGSKPVGEGSGSSWEELDLVKLESKAFLLGIWKDFYELETSISMPELIAILESKSESDYADKKFLAAIQGVDLEKDQGRQDEWTKLKEKVFGPKKTEEQENDVTSLTGKKAADAGFGIGMGLSYEKL